MRGEGRSTKLLVFPRPSPLVPRPLEGGGMRLSAKAQYACVALLELAANYSEGQLVQVKTIDQTAAPSSPVLNALKPPAAVQVVGSGARERRHRQPAELKPSPAVQAVGSLLQELDARERQMLAEITLSDLVRRTEQAGAPSYQI